ncbi:hypothetical protein B7463_g6093, partial [Scytalidium lignicola]
MNLNQTDLGHFIDQLTTSSKYFGFSDTDASTLSTFMNARYNVRCAPPVNGMLDSLCQATECPLAEPSPDCALYADLGPSGIGNSSAPAPTQAPSSTPAPSSTSTSSTPTSSTSLASSAAAASGSSSKLSSGAIAGIAIGGAAVVLIAVGLLIYFLRRPAKPQIIPVPYPTGGYASPNNPIHNTDPHTSFPPGGPHDSFMGMAVSPGYYVPKPPGEVAGYEVGHRGSPPLSPPMQQIAEMDSPHSPPLHHSISPPPMGDMDPSEYR